MKRLKDFMLKTIVWLQGDKLCTAVALMLVGGIAYADFVGDMNNAGNEGYHSNQEINDSYVQGKTNWDGGNFFKNLAKVVGIYVGKFTSITSATIVGTASGYAGKLTATALAVAGALVAVNLFWSILEYILKGGNLAHILLEVLVPGCIAGMLITGYAGHVGSFAAGLDVLRNLGGDTNAMITNLSKVFEGVFTLVDNAIDKAFEAIAEAGFTGLATGATMIAIGDLLLTGIFSIFTVFAALFILAEFAGLLLVGPFMLAVGIAFGPICVAGICTPWTREYLSKWLGFMVVAAAVTGVLGVILGLASAVVGQLLTADFGNTEMASAVSMGVAFMTLTTIRYLISQAPAMASALFPGTVGVRGGAGGMMAQAAVTTAAATVAGTKMAAGMNQSRWDRRYEQARREDWKSKHPDHKSMGQRMAGAARNAAAGFRDVARDFREASGKSPREFNSMARDATGGTSRMTSEGQKAASQRDAKYSGKDDSA